MDALSLYLSTYLLVDTFCIVMAVVIIRKVGGNFGSELEIRFFKHMIGFYLLLCLTDGLLLPFKSTAIQQNRMLCYALSSANMFSISLMSYFWFCFAQIKMRVYKLENRMAFALSQLPVTLLVVLYLLNPITGWMFTYSPEGAIIKGPLYLLSALLTGGYILWIAGQALVLMTRSKTKAQRNEYSVYVRFAIIPIISSVLDPMLPNTPIMALCMLAAILFVFSNLQDARIFNDALTGLNNRRRADQYLSDKIASASTDNAVYVYVLDVNLFKRINDIQGHMEGDHALQVVADGLRGAAGASGGFVARWGGDEFVLVVDAANAETPDAMIGVIDKNLQAARQAAGVSYDLSVSTGYAVCTSPDDDPSDLFERADHMLYEHKRQAHKMAA